MANELEVRVPITVRRGLDAIRDWSDDDFAAVLVALEKLAPNTVSSDVATALSAAAPSTPLASARAILDFVTQMRSLPVRAGVSVGTAASAIARAGEVVTTEEDTRSKLAARIEGLLTTPFVTLREKVLSLQHEPEPRFERARYIVDLRPIFDQDQEDHPAPVGVTVVGTLSIHLDGDHQDRTVSMRIDRAGLNDLQRVIERALDKHGRLETLMGDLSLTNLTLEDD